MSDKVPVSVTHFVSEQQCKKLGTQIEGGCATIDGIKYKVKNTLRPIEGLIPYARTGR